MSSWPRRRSGRPDRRTREIMAVSPAVSKGPRCERGKFLVAEIAALRRPRNFESHPFGPGGVRACPWSRCATRRLEDVAPGFCTRTRGLCLGTRRSDGPTHGLVAPPTGSAAPEPAWASSAAGFLAGEPAPAPGTAEFAVCGPAAVIRSADLVTGNAARAVPLQRRLHSRPPPGKLPGRESMAISPALRGG